MRTKETAVVICPGRGTYNAAELGYFARHHAGKKEFLTLVDAIRSRKDQTSISELDGAEKFRMGLHGTGDNASLLIFACAIADFMDVREKYDVVAVTGNSMGWYLALTCAGALSLEDGATLVNEMGSLMHEHGVGGQVVYPVVDENWQPDPEKLALVEQVLAEAEERKDVVVDVSIWLGGMVVFAANEGGVKFLAGRLPEEDRYPMQLKNHAAFHSGLLDHIVPEAQKRLPQSIFKEPDIPMVDGLGNIWTPHSTNDIKLYHYTLDAQISRTYNFSRAVEVSVKEFAPDRIVVLGPGTTMGGPVAQELIRYAWHGINNKSDFKAVQADKPYILSMGLPEQRALAIGS